MKLENIVNFIFELAQLKRIKHEGWRIAGVTELDTVGEHSLRAAQIGYILAHMEGYENPNEVCTMLVFHDIGECRIGDIHKVAIRYIEPNEKKAVEEQVLHLDKAGETIFNLWEQVEEKNTQAGIIAKDADYIEQAFTSKEYIEKGYSFAQAWIDNIEKALKTESAKKILQQLKISNSNDWWQHMKDVPTKQLYQTQPTSFHLNLKNFD